MKRLVSIDGRSSALTWRQDGEAFHLEFSPESGEAFAADASLIEAEPGIYSILIGAHSYEVKVVKGPEALYVDLQGRRHVVEVHDPRALTRRGQSGIGEGRQKVTAPMPGKVVRVLVSAGDRVEAGAGLVVVEAMKMQNELKASKAGRVIEVRAKAGDAVAGGEALVVIE